MRTFTIDDETQAKIEKWLLEEVYPEIVVEQKKDLAEKGEDSYVPFGYYDKDTPYPYSGAISGDTTYRFTPTSVGLALSVEAWGKVKNFTDFSKW